METAMTDDDNFFGDDLPETNDPATTTAKVIQTFKELMTAEEELEQVNALQENLKSKVGKIKTETFPDLLREMGTEIWRDPETGISIELETAVNSKLPEDREKRNDILNALRPIGIEEILGEEFKVVFIPNDRRAAVLRRFLGLPDPIVDVVEDEKTPAPRLTNEEASAIEELRQKLELGTLPAEEKLGVHASRLGAWLRRQVDAGKGKEISDAGIWHGKTAKVKKPDAPKGKKK
jgi:hypothetical protein